jgi:hypothetical protein
MKPSTFVVVLGILLAMTVAGPIHAGFIGVTFSPGNVYRFDESASATLVGPSGFRSLNSLAKDSSGDLYSLGFSDALGQAGFVRIDPSTGIGTLVAPNASSLDVRGLAFDASDTLFAIADAGGVGTDRLYTIELSDGTGQLVGSTGFLNVAGLEYDPSTDTLFAWDTTGTRGLITINTATGTGTDVSLLAGGTLDIQALAIGPDGNLFGARENLYSVNASTGAFSLVSNIGEDIRGLAFVIPEPASAALLAMGGLALLRRRRVRRA